MTFMDELIADRISDCEIWGYVCEERGQIVIVPGLAERERTARTRKTLGVVLCAEDQSVPVVIQPVSLSDVCAAASDDDGTPEAEMTRRRRKKRREE